MKGRIVVAENGHQKKEKKKREKKKTQNKEGKKKGPLFYFHLEMEYGSSGTHLVIKSEKEKEEKKNPTFRDKCRPRSFTPIFRKNIKEKNKKKKKKKKKSTAWITPRRESAYELGVRVKKKKKRGAGSCPPPSLKKKPPIYDFPFSFL